MRANSVLFRRPHDDSGRHHAVTFRARGPGPRPVELRDPHTVTIPAFCYHHELTFRLRYLSPANAPEQ